MNSTETLVLKFMSGAPVLLDDICAIFPATLREIASVGYDKFWQYIQFILIDKPVLKQGEGSDEFYELVKDISTFEYFILISNLDAESNTLAKEAFRFFIHDSISFSYEPAQIIVGPVEEKHIITEESFSELRRIIKKMYFLEDSDMDIMEDEDPRVARLKQQMLKNREKVAKAKARQHTDNDMSFSDLVGSLAVGQCGLNIHNIWDITYYAFQDQLKRMGWRDRFNINNRAALAGAKLKKSELKHWMRPIASEDKQ